MDHSPNLFALKAIVISLGLILFIGTGVFFVVFAHKLSADVKAAHCPDATVHFGKPGMVTGVVPQGDKVQITLGTGTGVKVLTIDRCTGGLQTLTVEP